MRRSRELLALVTVLAALAAFAAVAGVTAPAGGSSVTEYVTPRGDAALLQGRGLFGQDSVFVAAGNRGTGAAVLLLGVPLLLMTGWSTRQGSLRAHLLLLGTLAAFLYINASFALYTAYNRLFLLYIACFSVSLLAFVLCLATVDLSVLATRIKKDMPWRLLGWFMIGSGIVTFAIWLPPLLMALISGVAPERLDHYTVTVTDVLDLGVITPTSLIAGHLALNRSVLGLVLSMSLLVLEVLLAPLITLQTYFQLRAGIELTRVEVAGPLAGFVVLSLFASWVMVRLLSSVQDQGVPADGPPGAG